MREYKIKEGKLRQKALFRNKKDARERFKKQERLLGLLLLKQGVLNRRRERK